jgi:hypothetical protein
MRTTIVALAVAAVGSCLAADLSKETAAAFDHYIQETEAGLEPRFHGGEHFLGPGESPDWRQQLRRGGVLIQPTRSSGVVPIKGGMIQDWGGSIFMANTSMKRVLAVVQDYDRHKEIYKPEVAEARVRSRTGDDFEVSMRVVKSKLWISGVLNIDHQIRFTAVDSHRVYSQSYSRRIAEVTDVGKKTEHELPVGHDRGFLWRIYGYWFFEEADGGVYVTCQSITLTRDLPFALDRLLGPMLRELPAESLRNSLEETRSAVLRVAQANR